MKLYTAAITLFTIASVIGTGNAEERNLNLRRGLELFGDSVSAHHIIMLQSSSHFPIVLITPVITDSRMYCLLTYDSYVILVFCQFHQHLQTTSSESEDSLSSTSEDVTSTAATTTTSATTSTGTPCVNPSL